MAAAASLSLVSPSDPELVDRARQGDLDAYALLMTRYRLRFGRYAFHLLGNESDAEEALQDAFTLATHEFDPKKNELKALPKGQYCNVPMSFLILRDGKVTFDGDIRQLAHTKDEYIREYIS